MSREDFSGYLSITVGSSARGAGPIEPVVAAGMDDCLVVIYTRSGTDLGRRISLRHGLTIGRDSSSDLVLDSERLSRRHCELWGYGTTWMIRDLGSTNGTLVNGRRIDEAVFECVLQRLSPRTLEVVGDADVAAGKGQADVWVRAAGEPA